MKKILTVALIVGLFMGFLAFSGSVAAQGIAEKAITEVKIISLEGTASIKKAGAREWLSAKEGDVLNPGDTLRTDPLSNLKLNFDGSEETAVVSVSSNAELTFDKLAWDKLTDKKETILDLAIGSVLIQASELEGESKFEVNTPTSVVGVRGTTFEVRVSAAE